jgi:hypothetical protein
MRIAPPAFGFDPANRTGIMRRSERVSTCQTVRLLRDGAADIEVDLIDVSAEGFLLRCDEPLLADSLVWLQIEDFPLVSGRVKWRSEGKVGGEFSHRLNWRSLQRFRLADANRGIRAQPRGRIFK